MSTVRIQLRRGTASQWTSINPVLAAGEAGFESDTLKIKIGDGTAHWNDLGYATVTPTELSDAVAAGLGSQLTAEDVNTALGYTAANAADLSSLGSQTSTDISDAITTAESYTDTAIATEVIDRNSAISAKSVDTLSQAETFATNADTSLHSVVTGEIATAKSQAISTAEGYTDSAISSEITNRNSAIQTAVNNLVNSAPSTLDTLKEIADALTADEGTAATLATTVAGKLSKSGDSMTGDLVMGGHFVTSLAEPTGNTDAATKYYVDSNIQTLDADLRSYTDSSKSAAVSLAASNAASIYATKSAPTFTGTITASESSIDGITLKIGTVDGTKITDGTIHDVKIHDVDGSKIAIASIAGDRIISITEDQVTGLVTALGLKADLNSPSFSGTVVLPGTTSIGSTTSTEIGYLHGVTGAIQTSLTASSNHIAATTNVHGISDTSALATKTYADTAVAAETSNRATAVTAAIATANSYTDSSISTEVTNRNSAITTATANVVKTTDTGTVTSTMIADGTIATADIADSAITSAKIADGTIVNGDISNSAAIANSKLANSSVTVNGTSIALGASGTVTAAAGTLTGSTLASNVTSSSLTTVGTLGALAVTGDTSVGGTLTITGDIVITGNATINGTTETVNTTNLVVSDSIIYLADQNFNTDTLDIGFYGAYGTTGHTGASHVHSGLVRNHVDGKWYLFSNGIEPNSSTVDLTSVTLNTLKLDHIEGNVTGNADTATKLATARNINGVSFDGSAAITVKSSTTNALTIGTGLSGTSFDGSGAVTIAIDSTVATLTGTQTLTNKTLTSPSLSNAVHTGTTTVSSSGITFSDATVQTTAGVASLTTIGTAIAASNGTYYPSQYRDQMVPISGAYTLTIAPDGTNTAAIGTSVDFYQSAGTGGAFAAGAGVTILSTPGLKLRTTGSVATIMKTAANTWLLFGDLSA